MPKVKSKQIQSDPITLQQSILKEYAHTISCAKATIHTMQGMLRRTEVDLEAAMHGLAHVKAVIVSQYD